MMVRGQFSQLMAPGLHDIFVHWRDLTQRELEYPHIFHDETSTMAYEDEVEFSGLGPMPEKPEGESIAYQDAIQGATKRYLHYTYGLGCRTSFELFEDDQYKLINQVPKAIARSAVFTCEQQSWNVFNLGFTAAVTTTDGVSLFNNQHPLLGGPAATNVAPQAGFVGVSTLTGTFPNRPATDVDLSISALNLMVTQFEAMIDSQGLPVKVRPRHLIIAPPNKMIAREILGSPNKPYTGNNEINAIIGEDFDYFLGHYLTSATAWFCISDMESHTLKHFTRRALDEDYADDFDTRSIKQIAFMRFSVGATSWYGTWGSNGP